MSAFLTEYEAPLRLVLFVVVFSFMALWELLAPARSHHIASTANRASSHRKTTPIPPKPVRWLSNVSLMLLNTLLLRLLFPLAAVGFAQTAELHQWGLLNQIALPLWLNILVAVLLLDLAIYWQHVAFHRVPLLWRLHRVHHMDRAVDVTTAARFHTFEIILSMGLKAALIFFLGAPIVAVILFEILLSMGATFNHANVRLPDTLDRRLRLLLVTPNMHRVHHSDKKTETNSNYGFCLTWWDKLFASYRVKSRLQEDQMVLGLTEHPHATASLPHLLVNPFLSPATPKRDSRS